MKLTMVVSTLQMLVMCDYTLSPYLFTMYIDDVSNMSHSAGIGCHMHNCCTSRVFCTDDLCVIVRSPNRLQCLLNICAKFGFENKIEYNPTMWLSSGMSTYLL